MGREEEDKAGSSIRVRPDPGGRERAISFGISAFAPGICTINEVWAWQGSQDNHVEEVAVGESFEVAVNYTVNNQASSSDNYKATVTMANADHSIENYEDTVESGERTRTVNLGNFGDNVMPDGNGDLELHIKLWVNGDTGPSYPDPSLWY